jgi:hypothetical protein
LGSGIGKEAIVPTRDGLLTAVAGKGVERGLTPEMLGDYVALHYEGPVTEREDNLHKQSIRSLVGRIAPDWKIHIASMGESGFTVEVRPKPDRVEKIPAAAPGPVTEGQVIDLDNPQRIKQIADQLGHLAQELAELQILE